MKKKSFFPKKYAKYAEHTFLPTTEYIESFFPKSHLENIYLIACQHILPSTHMLIRSMINLGLDPDKIALIGKCYSTDQTVMENMLNEGIFVCNSSIEFDSYRSFDQQFQESVTLFLQAQIQRMKPARNAKIIILDDGGLLIYAAQNLIEQYPDICGIEQTFSGYQKLTSLSLKYPILNVTQSQAKLDVEYNLIAQSIINNLENKLKIYTSKPKEILIVGNGHLGNIIQKILKNECNQHNIVTYDIVEERSEIKYPDFSNFDLIIGATGNKVINHNYYDSLKKDAILASISSSDREFDAVNFRKLSGKKYNVHDDVYYKNLCLLNCGFPLNFSGGKKVSIQLMQIQFVCALLLLGVCESINCSAWNGQSIKFDKNFLIHSFKKFPVAA